MKKRDTFYITILFILPILFVLCVSTYSMYGSKLDWLSQHISLADYFRQTQQLLPDSFANLQGQTNAFSFSYYGLLRPDVLVSYLFLSSQYFAVELIFELSSTASSVLEQVPSLLKNIRIRM